MRKLPLLIFFVFAIVGCGGESGSMPGYGSTPDEIFDEYGENNFEPEEDTSLMHFYFNYTDESSYISAGMSEDEDIVFAFGLDFSETDAPERTYEETLNEAKRYMPSDAEVLSEEQTENGVMLRIGSDEAELEEANHQFNVELIEGESADIYTSVVMVADIELNNQHEEMDG